MYAPSIVTSLHFLSVSCFIPKPMFKLVADIVGEDMVEKIIKARKDKLDALQDSKSTQNFSSPLTRPSTPTPSPERR